MKKTLAMLLILFSISACKKDDSNNNAEPGNVFKDGYYLTLSDGTTGYEVTEDGLGHSLSCKIFKMGQSSCEIRAEISDKFKLYLSGDNNGGDIIGEYKYYRDVSEPLGGRTYSYTDKTSDDDPSGVGAVWWADSTIINITYSQVDSATPYANTLTTKGNYKSWVSYKNETKVISGEFTASGPF